MKFLWRKFWYFVWQASEFLGVSLGRFAPWIFAQLVGADSYKRIDNSTGGDKTK